jgi:hypothetical protein
MLQPLRTKSNNRAQIARSKTFPAPTAGWYVGDNQAAPPPKTAIVLNNAFPQLDYVRVRGGSAAWATGMGSTIPISSLMPWTTGVASKMFAVANNSIYDVSNSGAVGAAAVSGLSTSFLEYCQFEGFGGTYLVAVDGVDPVQIFDGTGWNRTFAYTGTLALNFSTTGTTTNGSIAVTGLASTANILYGQAVSGTNIPAGTTVLSVVVSTLYLSNAATGSGSVTLTFAAGLVTSMSSTANLQVGMALTGTGIPAVTATVPETTIAAINGSTLVLSQSATATGSQTLTFYQNAPITGYSGPGFAFAWGYKGRLYFADGTMNAYYLGLASIGGAATQLPLGAFFTLGGYLLCGATWAIDASYGAYQGNVFISSEGEVLMYAGDYPGASNWTLAGQYKISRPLGKRCLMRAGGDLLVMTEDGIVAMSQVMTLDQVALENVAATRPIAPAWRDAVLARSGQAGWQIVPWPLQTMVVINLPKQTTTDFTQYVVNSRTGAWAQYLGWDANCFAVFNNQLFYGSSVGTVVQAEIGAADNSLNGYTTTVMMAFSDMDAPGAQKQMRMVKPYVQATAALYQQISINVDFDQTLPAPPSPNVAISGALWDSALWDVAIWSGGLIGQTAWMDAQGEGEAISIVWQVTMNQGATTPDVRLAKFDALFEVGNVAGG